MAIFTIIVKGIAMVYSKGNSWKVIFPFDDCHTVRLSDGRNFDKTPLAKSERTIEFEIPAGTASQFDEGKGYDQFLNITASYAHFPMTLRKRIGWRKKGIMMTIPNAVFSSYETNNSRYKFLGPGGERQAFKKGHMSYSGQAVVEASKLTMKISDKAPEEYLQNATLVFDNGCDAETDETGGDLKLVYNIVKDTAPEGLEFSVIRHPGDDYKPGSVGPKNSINPHPGMKGLPCHMVTISQPADLLEEER